MDADGGWRMVDGGRRTADGGRQKIKTEKQKKKTKNEKQKNIRKKKINISDHCRRSSAVFGIVFEFFGKCLETFKPIDYILSGFLLRDKLNKLLRYDIFFSATRHAI